MPNDAVTRAGLIDADDCGFGAGVDRHARRNGDARADAGQFGIAGDADAERSGRRRALLFARRAASRSRSRRRPRAGIPESRICPRRCRKRLCKEARRSATRLRSRISLASMPSLRRRHIHQPFHDEGRNRPADAAIGAGRRLRGRHRLHAAAIVRDAIGPGQETHNLHRLERRRPRIDRIGADIADDVGAQAEDAAVVVERQFRIDDFVEALAAGGEVLQAVAGPFDRPRPAAAPRRRRKSPPDRASLCRQNRRPHRARPRESGRRGMSSAIASASRTMPGTCVAECSVSASRPARIRRDRRAARSRAGSCGACGNGRRRAPARRQTPRRLAALELAAHQHVGAGFVVQQRRVRDAQPLPGR